MAQHSLAQHRIRVGFLSAFFRDHIIADVSKGILAHLPRDRFEVYAIHVLGDLGEETVVAPYADQVVRLPKGSILQMRQDIAELNLDILVYVDIGMDIHTYLLAFSRLADVQCVLAGHPVTTGIPAMDYFISTAIFEPEGAQRHYSEKLIRLQNISGHFARFPVGQLVFPGMKARLGVPEGAHLYTCPVTLFKMHPTFDNAIIRVLRHDPGAVFVFVEANEAHFAPAFRHRLSKKDPTISDRIFLVPRMPVAEFLGFLAEADAVLDSFYFGAGTTALSAFGVGVPIITLPSPFMRGRVTYGCYRAMGILDAVASDADDFVTKALRLARDGVWRANLAERILASNHVLFEQLSSVTEHAAFFEQALTAKRTGMPLIDWPPSCDVAPT